MNALVIRKGKSQRIVSREMRRGGVEGCVGEVKVTGEVVGNHEKGTLGYPKREPKEQSKVGTQLETEKNLVETLTFNNDFN